MNAPAHTTDQSPESELRALAKAIDTFRTDAGMTIARLVTEYPELGSDKTLGLLRKDDSDLRELKIEERWLPAYRAGWARIQGDDQVFDAGLIDDLSGPKAVCKAYLETRKERGNSRFILILGDSGVGKTTALTVLKEKPYGIGHVIDVEALDIWHDKNNRGTDAPLLRAILAAMGVKNPPSSRDKLMMEVVEKLKGKPKCLAIDEAHHLCPRGANALKAIINLTPTIIIGAAMPILWDRLSSSRHGWVECKQLTTNRLAEKIYLRLERTDVEAFIPRAVLPGSYADDFAVKAAAAVADDARQHGNMKFVAKVVRRFNKEVAAGQASTLTTWANAIQIEKKRC